MRKVIVLGIIVLLFCLTIIPNINATIKKAKPGISDDVEMVEVKVNECLGLGMNRNYVEEIPLDKTIELREKLNEVRYPEAQLSLLKEYGVIDEAITWESIQNQFRKNYPDVDRADIINNPMINPTEFNITTINIACMIYGGGILSFPPPIFFTFPPYTPLGYFRVFPYFIVPVGIFSCFVGNISTSGLLGNRELGAWGISGIVIGFIGWWLNFAGLMFSIVGYALFFVGGYGWFLPPGL